MIFLVEAGAVNSTFQITECTVLRRYCLSYYYFFGLPGLFKWAMYSQKAKFKKLKGLKSSAF
jgi:hypothetical protein